ncbi:MAG: bacillithiol system redox-active protein YtxJ [Vicinamibacterales bacterium]|nr:bacillithiol system redox-active protein YtxJ [Vicinamibacterales bacterium]
MRHLSQPDIESLVLSTSDEVDQVFQDSHRRPALIFKHSVTCGISAQAYDELTAIAEALPVTIHVVPVQNSRQASLAVAQRSGIRHESPQVLLIVDGRAAWTASHFRITGKAVLQAATDTIAASGHARE